MGGMARRRLLLLAALPILAAAGGCRSGKDLDLLERERLSFKAENERIRAQDLEKAWEQARRRSDTLSEQVLAVGQERDRLYTRYDKLRSDLAHNRRDLAQAEKEQADLDAKLAAVKKRIAELEQELADGQARLAELERQAAEARAKEEAAGAGSDGASTKE